MIYLIFAQLFFCTYLTSFSPYLFSINRNCKLWNPEAEPRWHLELKGKYKTYLRLIINMFCNKTQALSTMYYYTFDNLMKNKKQNNTLLEQLKNLISNSWKRKNWYL